MNRFDLLPAAVDDLLALAAWSREHSAAAADALTDDLFDCFERLAEFPSLGVDRGDVLPGLRRFAFNRRRVHVYTLETDGALLIVRVVRQERRLQPEDLRSP